MPVGVRLDRARYDQLAKALREHKGNCSASARAAGVSRGTAERAWSRGWVSRGWEAVGPLIATEQREQAARPAVPVVEVDEAERQRQYTAKMAGAALTRGGNLLHLASRLEKYGVQLVTITEKASVEGVPPADAVRLLGAIARFQAKSVDVANAAIAIGKLVAGDAPPTINVNLLTDKTSAQIQLELEAALADLKAGEAAGLDGDGSSPTPPSPDTWAP